MVEPAESYEENAAARVPAGWIWPTATAGVFIGYFIVATRGTPSDPDLQVWSVLAMALTGTAGAVFVCGVVWWRDIRARWQVQWRTRAMLWWWWALAPFWVVAAIAPMFRGQPLAAGAALVTTALIGGSPLLAAAQGLRLAAEQDLYAPAAPWLYETKDLAERLRRLLIAAGALVTLATIALGASARVPGSTSVTAETVFVFGAMGSAVVGLMYLPAHGAVRRRALRVLAQYAPLPAETEIGALLATTERREALLKFLSVDIDTLSVFRNNIVLFGPLLSAGIGLFLQAG